MSLVPLLLLFAASGCSALIYEIVWLQWLQFTTGSSAIALGVLLAIFMGGMCAGSLTFARLVSPARHPLRVFAGIELAIGASAIGIWLAGARSPLWLLPPTLLMGASLPAVARWVQAPFRLGWLYAANLAGAVLGCLLAGFCLLRVYDMAAATFMAAAVNGAAGAVALVLAARWPHFAPAASPHSQARITAPWPVFVAIGLSGLSALGAEVVWTRLLSLILGATVYTFSIILAVFLVGLGIGSATGAYLVRRKVSARAALGISQFLLIAAIAWTAYQLAASLPYWPVDPKWAQRPWDKFQVELARCAWAILPAACLWGASFPLALAAVIRGDEDPGPVTGRVYAVNTAGAIIGALAFSLVLIPGVGTRNSERILMAASLAAALLASAQRGRILVLACPAAAAGLLAWYVPTVPWGVVAYGRQLTTRVTPGNLLYLGEGRNSSIAVTESYGTRMFHVSGKVEASAEQQDMRLQRMLGHIPALLHPRPRSVLVVGCGAGVTAGSFVPYPDVERIVICEIEPLIPPAAARYFARQNHAVLRDRRTRVVYDDARHYILNTPERFDIITSDPIHPWVKGSATLYTREYFELCKRHLNPGGLVTQWVPLYESSREAVKSEIATFYEAFPDTTIWGNDTIFEEGYDIVLLGSIADLKTLQRRFELPGVAQSLREVGFQSAAGLLATYAGSVHGLRPWLRDAQINRDRNLRLQYLAGLGLDAQGAVFIYDEILRYRK